jgi:regulator of sigma E protease
LAFYALAILSIGFLIVVHEGGHYFVARWCKMRIERFSIGFGPGILKRKNKAGTTFQIAPIPFGGFVEIKGMNIAEEVDPDDKFAYPNRPAWQRFITIFAGPATNYLSAILLAFALYTCHGEHSAERWIGVEKVLDGYDAQGKLEPGDRILKVDHVAIFADSKPGLTARVIDRQPAWSTGVPVTLTVRRDGREIDVAVTPKPSYDPNLKGSDIVGNLAQGKPYYLLGFQKSVQADTVQVGVLTAAKDALMYPVDQTKSIATALYDIVFNNAKADPGGPIRMGKEFAEAFKRGAPTGIELLMLLSVYLGLFNLFPLPALDGGRLVFLTYELITRRRANPKIEAMVHMAGIMVLLVVMVLVTLHDVGVL